MYVIYTIYVAVLYLPLLVINFQQIARISIAIVTRNYARSFGDLVSVLR